jgi:maltose O-acetyltransferase
MNKIYKLIRYDWPLHFILILSNWLPDNIFFLSLRGKLASPFFKKCGSNLLLGRNITFYNPSSIELGNSIYIAYGCWFLGVNSLIINDEVLFGPYVIISPGNHTNLNGSFRFGLPTSKKMTIGKGAWIGGHVCLLEGANVGRGVLIAANSSLNKTTEDHALYAGNPAKFVKNILQNDL